MRPRSKSLLAFPLGYATIGLVLTLRRPANPIGWLYSAAGLVWALIIPFEPWLDTLLVDRRPLALIGQVAVVARETSWAVAVALGIRSPWRSPSSAWCCTRPASRPRYCAWCCDSGPPGAWSASSCAGSSPAA